MLTTTKILLLSISRIIAAQKGKNMTTTFQPFKTHLNGNHASQNNTHIEITPQLEKTLPQQQQVKPKELLPNVEQKEIPLRHSSKAQDQLTLLLSQIYASQRTYSDKGQMMEYRDEIFQFVLQDFPISKIREAFIEFIKRSPDLPTPSDIYNILRPNPEPLSEAVYRSLKKRSSEGDFLYKIERKYIDAYEVRELAKIRNPT